MDKLYFDFNELFHSDIAKERGINNTTSSPTILTRLTQLVFYCLNPLRQKLGLPISIECAYRCAKLNEILKGAATGHPEGYCADIKVSGMTQVQLFDFIRKLGIEYDQLILEHNKDGDCVHIGYRHNNNRKQTMVRDIKGNYKNV